MIFYFKTGLPFSAVLPETRMTRAEAQRAIDDIQAEAADLPEITLDEISAVRAERKIPRRIQDF